MKNDSFIELLMARGLPSDLALRIRTRFSEWEALCKSNLEQLADFTPEEIDAIRRAKARREIDRLTVTRLINECEFRCCLCWDIDRDSGVVIHHIHPHAKNPDDRYENLVVLCTDHHDRVHTSRELTRHPYPPELLLRRKADFIVAIAEFRAGNRVAPGREKNSDIGVVALPPFPPSHFVGRGHLLEDIVKVLESPKGRAVVVGMGGIGKTALVLKVVNVYRQRFPGGILWAEIGSEFGGLSQILRSWIRSLGRDVVGMELDEQLALFAELVTKQMGVDGRLLLVIDDATERSLEDIVRLGSYVPGGVSILVTTREVTVGAAMGSIPFEIQPLDTSECRVLIESVSGSDLIRMEQDALDKLLSLLGGLPLAVELVGRQIAVRARKPNFSIAKLCERLEEFDPELLSFPGHRGIALSFALSFEHLDEDEQRIFRSLGIFALGPLNSTSVAAVCSTVEGKAESILDRLVAVSMLNWGTLAGDYFIHPLLHKYAEFLFVRRDEGEQTSARALFYQHYTSIALTVAQKDASNFEAIDRIFANLKKAIQFAAETGNHEVVAKTVLSLGVEMSFFTMRNLECESIPLLEMAINSARQCGDRNCEGACTGHLGTAWARLGIIQNAITHYEQAAAISRETCNDYDLANHLQNLGTTLISEGTDLPRAERVLHEALTTAERSRNADAVIGCLSNLGSLHRQIGKMQEAAKLYRGALDASRLAENRLSEGNNLSNLGLVLHELGNSEEGEEMIRAALAIAMEIGDKRGEGNRTGHIGRILIEKAQRLPQGGERSEILKKAREHIDTALAIAQETFDSEKEMAWQMNLGVLCALGGNDPESIIRFEEALRISCERGFAGLELQLRYNLGFAMVRLKQLQPAIDHFRVFSALLRSRGSPMADQVEEYICHLRSMLK